MPTNFYRLYDTATGEYWAGVRRWRKIGKIYGRRNDLVNSVNYAHLDTRFSRYRVYTYSEIDLENVRITSKPLSEWLEEKSTRATKPRKSFLVKFINQKMQDSGVRADYLGVRSNPVPSTWLYLGNDVTFTKVLTFDYLDSAGITYWKDTQGYTYRMFMSEFRKRMTEMERGTLTGTWGFIKRGQRVSIAKKED